MANTGISIDDQTLQDLDDIIWAKKLAGEIDRDTSRSEIIEGLVEEFVAENQRYLDEGNGRTAIAAVAN